MLHLFLLLAATSVLGCDVRPVRNIAKTEVSSTKISLNWTMLSGEDLQCVRGYKICATQGSFSSICVSVYNASMNEYTINNLTSCSTYYVTVVAVGENNTKSRTSDLVESTAPGPVTGLTIERKDDDTITALWNYSKTPERTCVTKFQLSLCDAIEKNCNHKEIAANSDYQYSQVLHKKPDCNAYSINIVAVDLNNQRSENFNFTNLPGLVGGPEHLRVTKYTSSSFDLEWGIPAAQENCGYVVRVDVHSVDGNNSSKYEYGTTKYSATNVISCTEYNISVSFETNEENRTSSVMSYTLPEDEKIFDSVAVQNLTSSSMTASWNTLLPNNECIAAYAVCWEKNGAASEDCHNTTKDENNLQITGLTASTKYQVTVAALLQTGEEFDKISLEARTMTVSGAGGLSSSSLVGISTMIYLLIFFI